MTTLFSDTFSSFLIYLFSASPVVQLARWEPVFPFRWGPIPTNYGFHIPIIVFTSLNFASVTQFTRVRKQGTHTRREFELSTMWSCDTSIYPPLDSSHRAPIYIKAQHEIVKLSALPIKVVWWVLSVWQWRTNMGFHFVASGVLKAWHRAPPRFYKLLQPVSQSNIVYIPHTRVMPCLDWCWRKHYVAPGS